MIPILFEKTETQFVSNGLGRLADAVRCEVTEERNGIYELELDYPVTGANFSSIQVGCIVLATHDEASDAQPFDIVSKSEPIEGIVTFRGQHVGYRANGLTVKPFTASTCAQAFLVLPTYIIGDNPFTFTTNKDVTADFNVTAPRSLRGLLAGEEGSILDVYGTGEYTFNRWNIDLSLHRGQDTDVSIVYGKNLVGFENEVDASEVYTAVVPFWTGTDDEGAEILITLPEWYISSGHAVPAGREIIVPMDLTNEFDEQPSVADLRAKATSRLASSNAWVPSQTVNIDFVQLWQTEEYKQFAPLQRLKLCDTCVVEVPMYNISFRTKVIRTVWNVLLDRYDEIELGDAPETFAQVLGEQVSETVEKAVTTVRNVLEGSIIEAMEQIRGGMGGYIVETLNADNQPIELLVTDNLDISQAVNIWRWNLGGLAHSHNGYNGPYDVAITQDGKINASMILTGVLSANLIRAGIISDTGGNNSWNLDTGVFKTTDANGWIQIKDGIVGFYNTSGTRFASLVHAFYDQLQTVDSLSVKSDSVLDLVGDVAVQVAGGELTVILEDTAGGGGGSDRTIAQGFWDSDGACINLDADKTSINGHTEIPDGVHGPTINSVQPGCVVPVPFLTFSDLGVAEGSTEAAVKAFITAWMKWICTQFPARGPSTIFVGSCRPGIRCLVNWVCYDTDDLSAQLPEYSVGLLIPFGANAVVYKFGTDGGSVYFNSNS